MGSIALGGVCLVSPLERRNGLFSKKEVCAQGGNDCYFQYMPSISWEVGHLDFPLQ